MKRLIPYSLAAEERLAFNGRLLELARHNGFAIEILGREWLVPHQLLNVAGTVIADLPA